MRHLISLKEQSKEDILTILNLAKQIKEKQSRGELTNFLSNKTLIMLFQKTSTRTRLSFEAAMTELGGHSVFLEYRTTQFALTDFRDEIKSVMRYGALLMFRAKQAADVLLAASFNQIPVIDGCSEKYHPCQALGDILTMAEHSGGLENVKKITWLGIENNVSNTLTLACAKLGIKTAIAAAEADPVCLDPELKKQRDATGNISYTLDLEQALKNTDYIHTDTWLNMEYFENGQVRPQYQEDYERRKAKFMPYQVNSALLAKYAPQAKIMHCLPAHIGYEITRDAIDHPNSIVFEQAENRLHIQKAIILWLLNKENII